MKKLITISLLIFTMSAMAQVDDYFANDPQWRLHVTFGGALPCLQFWDYVIYVNGHDTVNGHDYIKLFENRTIEYEWMGPPPVGCSGTYNYNSLRGLFRQEDKKIIMREDDSDIMIYDFDLAVGDTLPASPLLYEDNIYVTAIDSILVGETYRKVFSLSLSTGGIPGQIIEGIGFIYGFLSGFPDWFYPEELVCFSLDGAIYYENPSPTADCDMFVGIEQANTKSPGLEISPNPSHGLFTVSLTTHENQDIRLIIHDISGRIIKEELWPVENGNNVKSINLMDLKKGIYFLSLSDKDGRYFGQEKLVLF